MTAPTPIRKRSTWRDSPGIARPRHGKGKDGAPFEAKLRPADHFEYRPGSDPLTEAIRVEYERIVAGKAKGPIA